MHVLVLHKFFTSVTKNQGGEEYPTYYNKKEA
jgi:hypothetical protein